MANGNYREIEREIKISFSLSGNWRGVSKKKERKRQNELSTYKTREVGGGSRFDRSTLFAKVPSSKEERKARRETLPLPQSA